MLISLGMLLASAALEARRAQVLRRIPRRPLSRPAALDVALTTPLGILGLILLPISGVTDLALILAGLIVIPTVFSGTLRGLGFKGFLAALPGPILGATQLGLLIMWGR